MLLAPAVRRHVLVAVGADRWMRCWCIMTGACLAATFTGHAVGESITALAASPDNACLVTVDSAGYVKVWDATSLLLPLEAAAAAGHAASTASSISAAACGSDSAADRNALRQQWVWRAHLQPVCSVTWVQPPPAQGAAADAFILTAGLDHQLLLWACDGACVGAFGGTAWDLRRRGTWRSTMIAQLTVRERRRRGGGGGRCGGGRARGAGRRSPRAGTCLDGSSR